MKLTLLKITFALLLILTSYSARSQNDVISTVKGEKIICNIIKEDSSKVYFKLGGSVSNIEASIERSQISSIQYAPKKASETLPTLMQVPGQVDRDEYVAPTTTDVANPSVSPQVTPRKTNNISLCVGMSSPVGKFNSSILDTNQIGPAINGQMIAVGFTHLIKQNFGIKFTGFFSNNELNSGPITTKYSYNTDSNWTADKAYWKSFGLSFSLLYYKEINDFAIFAKLSGGYLSLKYPQLKLTNHSDNYLQFQSVTSDAISFGGGMGLSYKLTESLNVNFEVNYLQATCKYNEILILGEEPGTPVNKKISITKRDIKQTYQNVFISLGLNYWF